MKQVLCLFGIFISVFVSSCKETSFVPATQNVPLFTGKRQWRIDQSVSHKSFDAGIAYAPVRHLGTMLNFQASMHTFSVEPGIGGFAYFHPLVLELYAGYGFVAKNYYTWEPVVQSVDMQANRYFVQPSIGFHFNDYIEFALSAKTSYWEFSRYEIHEVRDVAMPETPLKVRQLTFEPVLTVKAGNEYIRGFMQAGIYLNGYEGIHSPDLYFSNSSPYLLKVGCTIPIKWSPPEPRFGHDNVRFF